MTKKIVLVLAMVSCLARAGTLPRRRRAEPTAAAPRRRTGGAERRADHRRGSEGAP